MPAFRNYCDSARRDSVGDDVNQYNTSQSINLDELEVYLAGITTMDKASRIQADGKISRQRNPFILFRTTYNMAMTAKGVTLDQNDVSRGAGSIWRALPPHRQEPYKQKANQEREFYTAVFKDYKQTQERKQQRIRDTDFKPYQATGATRRRAHKAKRAKYPSPSRSSMTRSSMESDCIPPSSSRSAHRPSRASKPELPMYVEEDVLMKEDEVKKESIEMSPDIHHFDMDVDKTISHVSTPKPSTYHRVDEQFGFRAGVDANTLPTLAALNSRSYDEFQMIASEIINDAPILQTPKKKKSKGKKRALMHGGSIHDDWELNSIQTVLDVDREMVFVDPYDEPMSFLGDFGPVEPSCSDEWCSMPYESMHL